MIDVRVKKDYMLKNVAGYYVVVPVGDGALNFNGIINLNESGATLWNAMTEDVTEEALVAALTAEYDVDETRAAEDVKAFVKKMKEANLIDE